MSRSLSVLGWILIGALASGLGIGIVLHTSNSDRARLADELSVAQTKLASLQAKQAQLTQDSDAQTAAAAQQVVKAQAELRAVLTFQNRLKTVPALPSPSPLETRRWSEFASVAMGVSLRVPPGMQTQSSDDGLFVSASHLVQSNPIEEQWFALTPYRPERERDILSRLSNTSEVSYALGTRLLQGVHGTLPDGLQTIYLLSVQENATTTHLLWGKTLGGVNEKMILNTIATLSFR